MIDTFAGIGNTRGGETDKFERFNLRLGAAEQVAVPLQRDCQANLERRVVNDVLLDRCDFFVVEVLKADGTRTPENLITLH